MSKQPATYDALDSPLHSTRCPYHFHLSTTANCIPYPSLTAEDRKQHLAIWTSDCQILPDGSKSHVHTNTLLQLICMTQGFFSLFPQIAPVDPCPSASEGAHSLHESFSKPLRTFQTLYAHVSVICRRKPAAARCQEVAASARQVICSQLFTG
jgi:hypothetical protein